MKQKGVALVNYLVYELVSYKFLTIIFYIFSTM